MSLELKIFFLCWWNFNGLLNSRLYIIYILILFCQHPIRWNFWCLHKTSFPNTEASVNGISKNGFCKSLNFTFKLLVLLWVQLKSTFYKNYVDDIFAFFASSEPSHSFWDGKISFQRQSMIFRKFLQKGDIKRSFHEFRKYHSNVATKDVDFYTNYYNGVSKNDFKMISKWFQNDFKMISILFNDYLKAILRKGSFGPNLINSCIYLFFS